MCPVGVEWVGIDTEVCVCMVVKVCVTVEGWKVCRY